MPTITISKEAHSLLRANARTELAEPGRRVGGKWIIKVDQDTIDKLDGIRFGGETYSDVLVRMFSIIKGAN